MENKKLFRIGEVAKMFHLSVSSLRHIKYDPIFAGVGYASF